MRDAVQAGLTLLQRLLGDVEVSNLTVRFWDHSIWRSPSGEMPEVTIVLRHEDSLRRMLRFPLELALAEAYIHDDVDIEGPIDRVMPLADHLLHRPWTVREWLQYAAASWKERRLERLPEEARSLELHGRRHGKSRDKQAVRFHFDLPFEFYRLWLDRHLLYSAAYYQHPDDNLDDAQTRMLDYVCRKLRLRPNDHLLDIGCGWGGLALHAAQEYGAVVHGITLSRCQADMANQRVAAAGLSRRCRIEVRDYRDVHGEALYDKIVSIGMIEHVGCAHLREFFERAEVLLAPGGVCLTQGIGARGGRSPVSLFADRYVFPDAEWPPLDDVLGAAEAVGFEVRDVESLREHYALTVDAWRDRLERCHPEVVHLVGEKTYRIWRVAMAAAAYLFRTGRATLYQTLALKGAKGEARVPLTRDDWYEPFSSALSRQRDAA